MADLTVNDMKDLAWENYLLRREIARLQAAAPAVEDAIDQPDEPDVPEVHTNGVHPVSA